EDFKVETVNSDAVAKAFLLENQRVGISYYGQDLPDGVPIASYIKRFVEEILATADDVTAIPKKIITYFRQSFPDLDTGFHVAGYKKEGKTSVPYVYRCHVGKDVIERRNIKPDGSLAYGASWSGQTDILTSIINPVVIKGEKGEDKVVRITAPIVWDAMPLQDAIDFSIYAIRTTIDTMRFQARPKTVGGPIDVLLITPDEAKFLHRKELHS
ncbi:unnamed protein product, partial [marine sediment metagenome]